MNTQIINLNNIYSTGFSAGSLILAAWLTMAISYVPPQQRISFPIIAILLPSPILSHSATPLLTFISFTSHLPFFSFPSSLFFSSLFRFSSSLFSAPSCSFLLPSYSPLFPLSSLLSPSTSCFHLSTIFSPLVSAPFSLIPSSVPRPIVPQSHNPSAVMNFQSQQGSQGKKGKPGLKRHYPKCMYGSHASTESSLQV